MFSFSRNDEKNQNNLFFVNMCSMLKTGKTTDMFSSSILLLGTLGKNRTEMARWQDPCCGSSLFQASLSQGSNNVLPTSLFEVVFNLCCVGCPGGSAGCVQSQLCRQMLGRDSEVSNSSGLVITWMDAFRQEKQNSLGEGQGRRDRL